MSSYDLLMFAERDRLQVGIHASPHDSRPLRHYMVKARES